MKINGNDNTSGIRSYLQKIQQGDPAVNERKLENTPSPQGDKVEISPKAREINKIKEILEEMPDVREKKVEELKKLVESGRYKVDLGGLSDQILKALIAGDL